MENIENKVNDETTISESTKEVSDSVKSENSEKTKTSRTYKKSASKDDNSAESILSDIAKATDTVDFASIEAMAQEKIGLDEKIPCVSMRFGGLHWRSPKTGSYFSWAGFGSVLHLTFDDLITMNNTNRNFLFKPLLVIQDPRVASHFGLLETYKDVRLTGQLDEIFKKSPQEINDALDRIMNANMRDLAISKVRQMRKEGTLTNIDVIKLIERKLFFDLSHDSSGR